MVVIDRPSFSELRSDPGKSNLFSWCASLHEVTRDRAEVAAHAVPCELTVAVAEIFKR